MLMQNAQPLIWDARVLTSSISDCSRPLDCTWVSSAVSALMASGAAWKKFMRGFMVILLGWGYILVRAARVKMVGLLEQQRSDKRGNQRGAEQEEHVAEGEDEGLL